MHKARFDSPVRQCSKAGQPRRRARRISASLEVEDVPVAGETVETVDAAAIVAVDGIGIEDHKESKQIISKCRQGDADNDTDEVNAASSVFLFHSIDLGDSNAYNLIIVILFRLRTKGDVKWALFGVSSLLLL